MVSITLVLLFHLSYLVQLYTVGICSRAECHQFSLKVHILPMCHDVCISVKIKSWNITERRDFDQKYQWFKAPWCTR